VPYSISFQKCMYYLENCFKKDFPNFDFFSFRFQFNMESKLLELFSLWTLKHQSLRLKVLVRKRILFRMDFKINN
jgi:hypothetical protein